ncbi:MAG: sodium:alanine symporter family protein [Clostridia bacterium]|nr:sodium:alanine symporter family protein [Clostridia bacterium]
MLELINSVLSGMLVPLFICAVGIFYAVKLRFFHLTKPLSIIRGLKSENSNSGVSSAAAVGLALAGTLGVGNIVGVSSAIYLGGFGAVFWIWLSALLSMILKYAEIVIAMRHRRTDKSGIFLGNAMLYIKDILYSRGLNRLGSALAAVFAVGFVLCSLTMGSMLQANAVSEALSGVCDIPIIATGVALAILSLLVGSRGTSGIIKVTNFLVPIMSVGYAIISVIVIFLNIHKIGDAFYLIFKGAFDFRCVIGGVCGYTFTQAIRYGVMRGLVSNEAGCGTAPTAHAIAECKSPARQGTWGIFEVFVDTIILCTMTALCVILEYDAASRYGGSYMMMTVSAYSEKLGVFAEYFLCAAVACFGFATIICWLHYGMTAVGYLAGNRSYKSTFIFLYALCVFIGSCISSDISWQLADLSMGIMTVINLTVIAFAWREVRYETLIFLGMTKRKRQYK